MKKTWKVADNAVMIVVLIVVGIIGSCLVVAERFNEGKPYGTGRPPEPSWIKKFLDRHPALTALILAIIFLIGIALVAMSNLTFR